MLPPACAATNDARLRQHSLRLIQLCLAALCKLELPAELQPASGGNALARLEGVLFGDGENPLLSQTSKHFARDLRAGAATRWRGWRVLFGDARLIRF